MHTIGESTLKSFCPMKCRIVAKKCTAIRKDSAVYVSDYIDLAKKIAELQYENRDHVLLLRGQPCDYRNAHNNTTIKPSIFRGANRNPNNTEMLKRFERLRKAEELLVQHYKDNGDLPRNREVMRRQILRWSILQHYEVCKTPLLDVTHSLRVAASFASDHDGDRGYVFVLGIPNISGAVTTSIENELQVIRLASVCPPQAFRPHIQEGYLLGEYPDIAVFEQKQLYRAHEVDFGRRLIAKFKFCKNPFWQNDNFNFPKIPREALYPVEGDEFFAFSEKLKSSLSCGKWACSV